MTHVFHRDTRGKLPVAVRGEGVYVIDSEGRRYLDASGGAAVSCLGHSDPDVIEAIKTQLDRLPFAHSAFFTTMPMEELARHLAARAPGALDYVYFVSGGSEAAEAAIKLARQYFLEIGEPDRSHFIARRQSYHGNTLGALSVGGNVWRRAPYTPMMMDCTHIAPCYAYRDRQEGESEADYGRRVADELAAAIETAGPDRVAAFVAEPVVGATAGALTAVPGYFERIREICNSYGILMILDEVMCGMGRTGTLYACEQEGVVPDILFAAKGIGAGYQPIGAVLVARHIYEAIRDGSGAFMHGHTYMGHATACAGAMAVQRKIDSADLLANVNRRGEELDQRLRARFDNHPHVGDIRGRGLFRAIELVRDRANKSTFDPAVKLHQRIKREAMGRGLICYPGGGTVDGRAGDHVLLAPPFVVDGDAIGEIVSRLGDAVDAAIADVRA